MQGRQENQKVYSITDMYNVHCQILKLASQANQRVGRQSYAIMNLAEFSAQILQKPEDPDDTDHYVWPRYTVQDMNNLINDFTTRVGFTKTVPARNSLIADVLNAVFGPSYHTHHHHHHLARGLFDVGFDYRNHRHHHHYHHQTDAFAAEQTVRLAADAVNAGAHVAREIVEMDTRLVGDAIGFLANFVDKIGDVVGVVAEVASVFIPK